MPNRCVVGGCSNEPDPKKGIALHKIPFPDDRRGDARKRRRKWIDFVKAKRAKWEPTQHSRICSAHFKPEDFERRFSSLPDIDNRRILIKDDIGISSIPSIHAAQLSRVDKVTEKPSSTRHRRRVLKEIISSDVVGDDDGAEVESTAASSSILDESSMLLDADSGEPDTDTVRDASCQTSQYCHGCKGLLSRNRQLRNKLKTLTEKLKDGCSTIKNLDVASSEQLSEDDEAENQTEEKEDDESRDYFEQIEEEPLLFSDGSSCTEYPDSQAETETETETENELEEDDGNLQRKRVLYVHGDNLRTEPKHIVFISQLLMLFRFCSACKFDNPFVETRTVGTMVEVTTTCSNPKCPKKEMLWRSQPEMTGTRIPAGNFLLCMAILVSGASASKVLQVFRNMGLACFSLTTYFEHQRDKLFPTIFLHWKSYQEQLISKLKEMREPVVVAGDGRHDSMGHSAKYCAYTIFCCSLPLIVHFSIVQRNVAGSSPAMEYLGFQNCMTYLLGCGLAIRAIITDRHTSIAKHMREQLSHITHYFDLWHLKKKVHKVLLKISKEKNGEVLTEWIKPCTNHLMWSATTTLSGNGNVIWAKFKSFLGHIINNHENHDDPLFEKCAHDEIEDRTWLDEESTVYMKVSKALTEGNLIKGIKKASPSEQTSCLEGFHSVLNQFAPKMICYSYPGMLCRHIIAALHFNNNLNREVKKNTDGVEQVKIVYPKFKNGEATVRDVRIKPDFSYVEDIYQTFLGAQREGLLRGAKEEIAAMCPPPMNTMLQKQPRDAAIRKRRERQSMVVQDVPPTATVTFAANQEPQRPRAQKEKPCCTICKHPMKGHKNVANCPKNQHE